MPREAKVGGRVWHEYIILLKNKKQNTKYKKIQNKETLLSCLCRIELESLCATLGYKPTDCVVTDYCARRSQAHPGTGSFCGDGVEVMCQAAFPSRLRTPTVTGVQQWRR